MYKLAIIGSRGFDCYGTLSIQLRDIKDKVSLVVSGGAKGADSLGEQWANENNIPTKIFKPDWDKYGKRAGYVRNKDIISECDACIAFWDGESKGTQHSFKLCEELNKPLKVIKYKELTPF